MIFLLLLSYFSFAEQTICKDIPPLETDYNITTYYCDKNQVLTKTVKTFKSTNSPSTITWYENNKPIKKETYNKDFKKTSLYKYSYNADGTYLKQNIDVASGKVKHKWLYQGSSPLDITDTVLAEWYYDEDNNYNLDFYNYYTYIENKKFVLKREIFQNDAVINTYVYSYPKVINEFNHIDGFMKYDDKNNLVSQYFTNKNIYPNFDDLQKKEFLLAVIDGGFEVQHPELVDKWYKNPKEIINNIDDDNNGVVDDVIGWYVSDHGVFDNNLNERISIYISAYPRFPYSHGTHTATAALKNTKNTNLIAFAGNSSDVNHLEKINAFSKTTPIHFMNMSFSFENWKDPASPGMKSFTAIKTLIEENPESLIAVAAGNSGKDLDESYSNKSYPASYQYSNILSVGALDTGVFDYLEAHNYAPADFSNYGIRSVDIFAPGTDLLSGNVGKDYVRTSGTSMASPYALNIAILIAENFPNLKPMTIKDILLYSAYIPDINEPFDCVSGGMIYPERAQAVANLVSTQNKNPREASLEVRRNKAYLLSGESVQPSYLEKLKILWSERGL